MHAVSLYHTCQMTRLINAKGGSWSVRDHGYYCRRGLISHWCSWIWQAVSVREYLKTNGYSEAFARLYLVPMAAALWSSTAADVMAHSALALISFFHNHLMLQVREFASGFWLFLSTIVAASNCCRGFMFPEPSEYLSRRHVPVGRSSSNLDAVAFEDIQYVASGVAASAVNSREM